MLPATAPAPPQLGSHPVPQTTLLKPLGPGDRRSSGPNTRLSFPDHKHQTMRPAMGQSERPGVLYWSTSRKHSKKLLQGPAGLLGEVTISWCWKCSHTGQRQREREREVPSLSPQSFYGGIDSWTLGPCTFLASWILFTLLRWPARTPLSDPPAQTPPIRHLRWVASSL